MSISKATFVTSSVTYSNNPAIDCPTYAFIGRSNVGKSSLINMLLNRKNLAKTSSTPGKTNTMNYFLINDSWYMVDLPGYGWARVSQKLRQQWMRMVREYLLFSPSLTHLFVLIDARHPPQKIDLQFITWLVNHKTHFSIVFTKIDTAKSQKVKQNIALFQDRMIEITAYLPTFYSTSARKKQGKDALLNYISTLNTSKSV